jgi:hypothetical protein
LPPDELAVELLAELQRRGISVAIWDAQTIGNDTTYFACRFVDRDRVTEAIQRLESQGVLPPDYLARRGEYLFSLVSRQQ